MVLALIAIGLGLIVALGGIILLTRQRHTRKLYPTYALSTVIGLALMAAGFFAW